jgi:hypothetical protein
LCSIAAAYIAAQLDAEARAGARMARPPSPFRVVVLCPPHPLAKRQREILATPPGAEAWIIDPLGAVDGALRHVNAPLQFLLLPHKRATLGSARRSGARRRPMPGEAASGERSPCCPRCGRLLPRARDGPRLGDEAIVRQRARCDHCRSIFALRPRN